MKDFTNTYLGKYAIASQQSIIKEKASSLVKRARESISPLVRVPDRLSESIIESSTKSLVNLSAGAADNLFAVKTVFPFVFFADTLKIDRQKLTIVHNDFLKVSQTSSIRLKDLRNVETILGPFFGTVILTSQHFLNNTQTINFLKRRDAVYAQRLLQGFMVAHDAGIDTNDIEAHTLLSLLNKIGKENL